MALELRPNCEFCDIDLPPDSIIAYICTYECTFCSSCVEKLQNVCPNCGGGFEPRPIRPSQAWREGLSLDHQPASNVRVHNKKDRSKLPDFVSQITNISPEKR